MNPSPVKGAGNWIPVAKTPPSRRTRSFSSSSSTSPSSMSSSSADSQSRWSRTLSGIPFSWEQQPGIPKEYHSPASKDRDLPCQDLLLPLPPAAPSTISKKKSLSPLEEDPFLAALKECSKDHHHHHHHHHHFSQSHLQVEEAKVTRSLSDRFGSCKRTCSVIDSTVFVRKPNRRGYYMLDRRSA